jgi:hypothetical protein
MTKSKVDWAGAHHQRDSGQRRRCFGACGDARLGSLELGLYAEQNSGGALEFWSPEQAPTSSTVAALDGRTARTRYRFLNDTIR